jgi:hypothetical protein
VVATRLQPNSQLPGSGPAIPLEANNDLPVLRQVAQVRNLSASEAARGYPVRIRGTLTYIDSNNTIQFIQDSSGGIFVDLKRKKFEAFPEELKLVEITGFTGPGDFAPVIEAEQLSVLGEAVMPQPASTPMPVLLTGSEDSQWVALNGVVRSQTVVDNQTVMRLAADNAVIEVTVPNASEHFAPHNFVDASVEMRGVVGTVFDKQRHLQGIRLYVPNWEEVRTWSVGIEDPFSLPVQPLNKLLEFHAGGEGLHRTHVRGMVLSSQADGSFYLQDATGGILVRAQPTSALVKVGRMLDVAGFPAIANKLPVLQEAVVRAATENLALQPSRVSPESPLSQELHGTLVRLQARVIGHLVGTTEESLKLQFGPWITDAILEKNQPAEKLGNLVSGSTVELTGVYLARLDDSLNVQSFQVRLRSPDDIAVLARPAWWTAGRVLWLLAALGTAFALVLTWGTLLRRQVRERTSELLAEIEVRKDIEAQAEKTHKKLLAVSRSAGMAEVATNVLHNVGNVLNSVNVSATLVVDMAKNSQAPSLGKVVALLNEHVNDLGTFMTRNAKGAQLKNYLALLAEQAHQRNCGHATELRQDFRRDGNRPGHRLGGRCPAHEPGNAERAGNPIDPGIPRRASDCPREAQSLADLGKFDPQRQDCLCRFGTEGQADQNSTFQIGSGSPDRAQ